jgi:hypothetical protein
MQKRLVCRLIFNLSYILLKNSYILASVACLQIGRIHSASEKFVTLLPFLALKKDIEHSEVDCSSKNLDIPIASKLRVLTGMLLLILC